MPDKEAFYEQIADLAVKIQTELVSLGYQDQPGEVPIKA